jgi:Xaa-Pro aminopeptidase
MIPRHRALRPGRESRSSDGRWTSGWVFATIMVMTKPFERHRQAWTPDEIQKLHTLAKKGMALKAIAKALTRSEESVKERAKADQLGINKLR